MRIEAVSSSPDRAGRYKVTFQEGKAKFFYRQTVEDHGLYPGRELTEEEYETLLRDAGAMSAKMRAVRIVSASSVSKGDLEQRLIHKGEDPAQAKAAVQWLSDMDVLDDEKTAQQVVSRCISKGYGLQRAKQALYEKRIPKSCWDAALANYPDQTEAIESFLRTRLGSTWEERDLRRAIDALIRRGHNYSQIRSVLETLKADNDFLEGNEWQI